jgi:group I intron endonuclease
MINGVKIGNESAIYSIVNLINGKMYIGSAVNLQKRRGSHLSRLRKNNHHSIALQNAFNKYKEDNFSFELIEYVEEKELLIKREQVWIDFLKPEYNICKLAISKLGVSPSEETREKNRQAVLGSKNGMYNKKHSEESILKMRKTLEGRVSSRKGVKFTEEHINKLKAYQSNRPKEHNINMGKTKKGNTFAIQKEVLNLENGIYYSDMKSAWGSFGVGAQSTFRSKLNGRLKNNTSFIQLN